MGLGDVLDAVERREKTLTVFNPASTDGMVDDLAAYVADLNVEVRGETTPSGRPAEFAVLEVDGRVLEAVDLDALRALRDDVPSGPGDLGVGEGEQRAVLQYLSEATFTSRDRDRMLAATREIEDRAFRVGSGSLRVGFQTVANLRAQRERYAELAARGLDLHLYASPGGEALGDAPTADALGDAVDDALSDDAADDDAPSIDGATVTLLDDPDVREHWFVAFDGGEEDRQCCALVAAERASGRYSGFWTYDPDVVERVLAQVRGLERRCAP